MIDDTPKRKLEIIKSKIKRYIKDNLESTKGKQSLIENEKYCLEIKEDEDSDEKTKYFIDPKSSSHIFISESEINIYFHRHHPPSDDWKEYIRDEDIDSLGTAAMDITIDKITVFDEYFLPLAKKLAKEIGINRIYRGWEYKEDKEK